MSYQRRSNFVMLGDLLISTPGKQQRAPLSVPTRFDARFPISNLELSGLQQKIVVLRDTLVAAWAGSHVVARSILSEIQNKLSEPYSGEKILSIIDKMNLSENEKNSVSFIFYAMNRSDSNAPTQIIVQDYLVGETIFGTEHKVKYSGSGRFHFFDTISFEFKRTSGSINEFEMSVATFLTRAAIAFYNEIVSDVNHNYYYGGGFELLVPNPTKQRFEKLPFASAFWLADGKDGLKLIGPIFTNQYIENKELVISRIHYEKDEPVLTRFVVPHMFSAGEKKRTMPTPDFDPFFVVHYIIDTRDEGVRLVLKKGKDKNIRFSMDESNTFSVSHTGEFVAEVLDWKAPP